MWLLYIIYLQLKNFYYKVKIINSKDISLGDFIPYRVIKSIWNKLIQHYQVKKMVTKDNSFSQKRVMRKWGYLYKSPGFSHTFSNASYLIIFIFVYVIYKKKLIILGSQSSFSNALVLPAHNWSCQNMFVIESSISRGSNIPIIKLSSALKSGVN